MIRNIGLQENRLEQLLFGANTQGNLFAQAIVAGTKPLLKLGLLKPDSHAALELGVGVLRVVWRPGVGSARVLQVLSPCLNLEPNLEAPCWCYSVSLVG